jgi:uncharacterized protein (TIGR03118 family)
MGRGSSGWLWIFGRRKAIWRPVRFQPALEGLENRCLLTGGFLQTNLVSDLPGQAAFTDANLVNPWGLLAGAEGPFWVADNNVGASTLYDGNGQPQDPASPLVVAIPPADALDGNMPGEPTGVAINNGSGFIVAAGGLWGPSQFLFATQDGTIAGWNPDVNGGQAIVAVNNSAEAMGGAGAVYLGLTVADTAQGTFLYAANFRSGSIDVFDSNFQPAQLSGWFADPQLPAGFAPFNIQSIGNLLYVTYAQQDAAKYQDVAGPGRGFVDAFDTNGNLVQRLAGGAAFNAPWGVAQAPAGFGPFGNDVLVGNFGDGHINAFDPTTGAFRGTVQDTTGRPLAIDGLWGLSFGNGAGAGDRNTLYFTAGIQDRQHGLFGKLAPPDVVDVQPKTGGGPQGPLYALKSTTSSGTDTYPILPTGSPALRSDTGVKPMVFPAPLPLQDAIVAQSFTARVSGDSGHEPVGMTVPVSVAVVGSNQATGPAAGEAAQGGRGVALNLLMDLNAHPEAGEKGMVRDGSGTRLAHLPGQDFGKGQVLLAAVAPAAAPNFSDHEPESADSKRDMVLAGGELLSRFDAAEPASVADELVQIVPTDTALAISEPARLPVADSPARITEPANLPERDEQGTADNPSTPLWTRLLGVGLLVVGVRLAWWLGRALGRDVSTRKPITDVNWVNREAAAAIGPRA